jgi:hypothetical protein
MPKPASNRSLRKPKPPARPPAEAATDTATETDHGTAPERPKPNAATPYREQTTESKPQQLLNATSPPLRKQQQETPNRATRKSTCPAAHPKLASPEATTTPREATP